jgi:hypothetical protein
LIKHGFIILAFIVPNALKKILHVCLRRKKTLKLKLLVYHLKNKYAHKKKRATWFLLQRVFSNKKTALCKKIDF